MSGKKDSKKVADKSKASSKLVAMKKINLDGDVVRTADVHPDEVANFQAGGWSK